MLIMMERNDSTCLLKDGLS